jgi:hypothetical protein
MGPTGAFFPRLRGLNLHDLSKDGKIDELKSAIADKSDPNIIHPKTGRTPLQYAADANQVSVIKELLANAAETLKNDMINHELGGSSLLQ